MNKRVLITSVDAGGGHVAVMDSLDKTLNRPSEDKQVKVVKYYSKQKFYDSIYRLMARSPRLLEFIHYSSIRLVRWCKSLVVLPELAGARKVLKATRPNIVICTHPFQSLAFKQLRDKLHLSYKIVTCICDYGDPKEYMEYAPGVDHYLVRDETTRQEALKYLPDESHSVLIFGTVVDEVFEKYGRMADDEVAKEFETFLKETFGAKAAEYDPNKPSLLFIGGSGWVRKSKKLIKRFADSARYNLLVCCGKDQQLRTELCNMEGLFCFDFLSHDKLALIERAADSVVMSTLAPASMYELLTINHYPLFVHRYHARQEAPHIQLLSDWKIGFYEPDDQKMMQLVEDYLANPAKYQEYLENGAKRCADEQKKAADNYKLVFDMAS